MAKLTFKRYETKYIINKEQYTKLMNLVDEYLVPDVYGDKSLYHIFNIYFDSHDYHVIRTSLSKPVYKEKLRLRSYKANPDPDDFVFLELKKKVNKIVSKRRIMLTYDQALDYIHYQKEPLLKSDLDKQIIKEISYFIKCNEVSPKVFISYDRKAYFSPQDSSFRMTFDFNIRARENNLKLDVLEADRLLLEEDFFLMEVKSISGYPQWFIDFLSKEKIYHQSFSKYGKEFELLIKQGGYEYVL